MFRRLLVIALSAFALLLASAGCSFDIEPGSQLAGQQCYGDDDCAQDLVCFDRICRPKAGDSPWGPGIDADLPDTDLPDADTPDARRPDIGPPDVGPRDVGPPDVGPECVIGESYCYSGASVSFCEPGPDGVPAWSQPQACGTNQICEAGQCVNDCPEGFFYDPIADECIPEDEPVCCEGGCADNEICHDCSCVPYDPEACVMQDQPCDHPGQVIIEWACVDFDGVNQPRCMGICDPTAPDPDTTCPDDSSVCLYDEGAGSNEGICMSSCNINEPCADDGMHCIYFDGTSADGICYPSTGSGQHGDPCDAQDPFSCADSALCIEGTCMQSCRPFDQPQTDCAQGNCIPFDDNIGVCFMDSADGQGGCTMENTTCGEDATGCYPSSDPGGGLQCYEFCRLEQGSDDCTADTDVCHRFDQQQEVLGLCGPGFTTQ